MARILAVSSQVVRGHVGLSAIVPALQRLGHEALAIPTIVMSNHPGHPRAAGSRIEVNTLVSILDVLDTNGWLGTVEAVMTGYLPTPEHVFFARQTIDRVRQRSAKALVLVDPVIGDDPKGVYIDPVAAAAIRDDLVPRADIITPNRFELSWLSGIDVTSDETAAEASRRLGRPRVLATSIPGAAESLRNVMISKMGISVCAVERRPRVPHGTGDLLSGLLVGHLMHVANYDQALGLAVAGVEAAIKASHASTDMVLAIAAGDTDWSAVPPLPVTATPATG
jgi:pyridoxine kinase